MIEEVEKYLDPDKGYFFKHVRRHHFIKKNINLVANVYDVDTKGYTVHSLFITNEAISIQFMQKRQLPMPIFSIYDLNELGYERFVNKLNL